MTIDTRMKRYQNKGDIMRVGRKTLIVTIVVAALALAAVAVVPAIAAAGRGGAGWMMGGRWGAVPREACAGAPGRPWTRSPHCWA